MWLSWMHWITLNTLIGFLILKPNQNIFNNYSVYNAIFYTSLILYQSLHYKYYNRYPYSNTIKYNDRKYCNVNETLKECFRIADVNNCHSLRLFVMLYLGINVPCLGLYNHRLATTITFIQSKNIETYFFPIWFDNLWKNKHYCKCWSAKHKLFSVRCTHRQKAIINKHLYQFLL